MTETEALRGYVCSGEKNVFSSFVKIEVERAEIDSKFVHLRFCHSNKYWARVRNDVWIVASSDQPEEDTSKWSCTLFEPTSFPNDGFLYFTHVQTGGHVRTNFADSRDNNNSRVFVHDKGDSVPCNNAFTFVDWDTLVIMPRHVAFKGYNGKYLKSGWIERHQYLRFSSDDGIEEATGYEVTMNPEGYLRIKSDFLASFGGVVLIGYGQIQLMLLATTLTLCFGRSKLMTIPSLFAMEVTTTSVKVDLTTEGKTNCLNAAVSNITTEARLRVEELVFEREIFDVIYHMKDSRIFDGRAILAGTARAVNEKREAASLTLRVGFEDTSSFTFSNSLSINVGVKTTIKTRFARIVEGKIEVSAQVTNSFEWNRTTTETKTAKASYTAVVPARSRARVNYVATRGTCNIPFSYTQRDRRSSDGSFITTREMDGVYTGVNNYSFHFEQLEIKRL